MSAFFQIFSYLTLIIIIFVGGIPFILLLKKNCEGKGWIAETFLFGIGFWILLCFWCSCLGIAFANSSIFILWSVLCTSIGICIYKRNKLLLLVKQVRIEDCFLILISIFAGSMVLIMPVVWNAVFPYCDGYTYISIADYMLEHSYHTPIVKDTIISHPWLSQMYIYQGCGFRIGSQIFLAFTTGLFNSTKSIELLMPCTALGIIGICAAADCFVQKICKKCNLWMRVLGIVLIGFNAPIIQWNAVYGFYPQTIGTIFCLALIAIVLELPIWKENNCYCIFFASFMAANLALNYNEMLPFAVLSISCLTVFYIIKDKKIKEYIDNLFITMVFSLILISPYFLKMIKALLRQLGAVVGWNQNNSLLTYISYILSTVRPESQQTTTISFGFFVTIILCGLIIYGVAKMIRERDISLIKFVAIAVPYLLMFFYFSTIVNNPFGEGRGNSWSIFKLVQYFAIVLIPFLAIVLGNLIGVKLYQKIVASIGVLLFVIVNVYSITAYSNELAESMRAYTGNTVNPIGEYYDLEEKYNSPSNHIKLVNVPQKHRQMVTYFLKDAYLYSDWKSDGYYSSMENDNANSSQVQFCLVDQNEGEGIANLAEKSFVIEFKEGFYGEESDGDNKWHWAENEAVLSISNYEKDIKVLLEMYVSSAPGTEGVLSIFNENGTLIEEKHITNNLEVIYLEMMNDGVSNVLFKYSGKSKEPTENDPRNLCFGIWNWKTVGQ